MTHLEANNSFGNLGDLDELVEHARQAFRAAASPAALEDAKARFLGKTGSVTEKLKGLAQLAPDEKRLQGKRINELKATVELLLRERRDELAHELEARQLAEQSLDVTLPGRARQRGAVHPVSRTIERVQTIFASMGFDVADGPEIENDWFNFTALNTPEDHPARSMHDTFYVEDGLLLRTHTSPMQIRYGVRQAQAGAREIRVIAPGRTYRVDSDATHSPMFHQCEGLWLGANVSFADLKSVFTFFLQEFFETTQLKLRFRPSFFPFTEPSAEVDLMFTEGALAGRWLEVAGSGQVHPQVVRNIGLDPETSLGFAFGAGMERLTMLRYGVNDLRLFFDNDLRFLRQFA